MIESLRQATGEAGGFGGLVVVGGGVAALLVVITVFLTLTKRSNAAAYASASCLLGALALLGLGEVGFLAGLIETLRVHPDVPKGAMRELRVNLFLALCAAALPLVAGLAGVVVARVRVGIVLGVATVAAWALVLVHSAWPLPQGLTGAAPEGIQLPRSVSPTPLEVAALVAVTPGALWVDGVKVEPAQLANALNRAPDTSVLPLMVDERVTCSTLAGVLEAAGEANRHVFALVVLSSDGAHRVIRFRDGRAAAPAGGTDPQLTVAISTEGFRVMVKGSSLDPMPLDWELLSSKLAEIKTFIPENQTVYVTAAPEVTTGQFAKTLDAISQRGGALLNADLVVGEPSP